MSSPRRYFLLGLLAMLSITGCPELEGRTQIVVTVRSDLRVPSEIDRVTIAIPENAAQIPATADLTEQPLPRSVGLVHESGPLGPFSVHVAAWLGSEKVVEKTVVASFVEGKTVHIDVALESSVFDPDAGGPGEPDAGDGDAEEDAGGPPDPVDDAGDPPVEPDAGTDSGPIIELPGDPPTCTITLPVLGDAYQTGASVPLNGSCIDPERGVLSDGLFWKSDVDGPLGVGEQIAASLTTVGTHSVALCAPDPVDETIVACSPAVSVQATLEAQPSASIMNVQQGSTLAPPFIPGTTLQVAGLASGAGVTLSWVDSLQGVVAMTANADMLSPVLGRHVLTFTVTARDGSTATDTIEFDVLQPTQTNLVSPFPQVNTTLAGTGNAAVQAMVVDLPSDRVYLGASAGGLYVFAGTNPQATTSVAVAAGPLPGVVRDVLFNAANSLAYVATANGLSVCGYAQASGINSTCTTYSGGDFPSNNLFSVARVRPLLNDYLLVGTSSGLFTAEEPEGSNQGYAEYATRTIRAMTFHDGYEWLATSNGLYRHSPILGSTFAQRYANGAPGTDLTSVAVDRQNKLWAGSNTGLGRFDPDEEAWSGVWRTAAGLAHDQVRDVAIHRATIGGVARDVIWIATDGGVTRFDPSVPSFTSFTTADGLPSNSVSHVAVLANGTKLFATGLGVAYYTGP